MDEQRRKGWNAMAETQDEAVTSLRKQVRLLSIALFGLGVLVCTLTIRELTKHPGSDSGWPNMNAGNLQVKTIILMTDDGKAAGTLGVVGGTSGLALADSAGNIRVLLAVDGNKGMLRIGGDGEGDSTNIENGVLLVGGSTKEGGVIMKGPSAGGPSIQVFDSSGYSTTVGRTYVLNHLDGTESATSTASFTRSSKDRSATWRLLDQAIPLPTSIPSRKTP